MPFTIASTVYYSIKSKKNLQDICAKYVKLLIDIKDLINELILLKLMYRLVQSNFSKNPGVCMVSMCGNG